MKLFLSLIVFVVVHNPVCISQTINILSVTHAREPILEDGGYTLDASYTMTPGSRPKLLSTTNFGAGGIYPKIVNILDGFATSNSLTQVVNFPYNDIFFFGVFNKTDAALVQFTNEEIDSLYNWSRRGGKLIICGSASPDGLFPIASNGDYNPFVLNSKWGFQITNVEPSSFTPNSIGLNTDIFNGPFGSLSNANQGGGAQGYFSLLPGNVSVLATDVNNNPTIIMDCSTLDLIVADVDGYTSNPGAISLGSAIANDQDKYWANTIVFMDKLQAIPTINLNGFDLSATNIYNGYQWYKDNTAISGSVGSSISINQQGQYYVEVTMNGGCKVKSNTISTDSTLVIKENAAAVGSMKNFPNPSQNQSTIEYTLSKGETQGEIIIYDIAGVEVKRVMVTNNSNKIVLDNSALHSGTYFYQLITSKGSLSMKKMVIIK